LDAVEGLGNSGYMFIITDKDEYSPGDMIRGKIFIDFFVPCKQKDLNIKFKGTQNIPE
jgi:hypothetical protein